MGISYEATVPDTLDLAERARYAVNMLTGINRGPEERYQPSQCAWFYRNPPVLSNEPGPYAVFKSGNEMWGKYLEALIEMRLISGSEQDIELDKKSIEGMISCIEDDNLFWSLVSKRDPNDETRLIDGEDFCNLASGSRCMLALIAYYELTGDDEILKQVGRLAQGYKDSVIHKDNYVYYPNGYTGGALSMPRSGWKNFDEPLGLKFHDVGWYDSASIVIYTFGSLVQALCRWHLISRDEKAMDLADKVVNYMLKSRFWSPECDPLGVVSAEHAHFEGHIHAVLRGYIGLAEYAILTNNEKLKLFVNDGYEYVRTFGIPRIGMFGETCTVGDMTCLAVRLSDSGIRDCWEDIDQYVRNHLVETQLLDMNKVKEIVEKCHSRTPMPWERTEGFFEKTFGALCDDASHPTVATPGAMFCCSYNGFIGIYYAYDAIIRCDNNGAAKVNLLLNRASPWLDVDSYQPYEGRVVIKNKTATSISVRIPRFAPLDTVSAVINGKIAERTFFVGQYMVFPCTKPGDVIDITFDLPVSIETYILGWSRIYVPGWTEITQPYARANPGPNIEYRLCNSYMPSEEREKFTFTFKGNTVIDVTPREDANAYPIYLRDHYKGNKAPMKTIRRYIADKMIDWRTKF